MSKTIYIGGRLESKEKGNVVTGANAILDDTKGKKQNVINKETDDELARLEQSKQDNLNFDSTPTEDSTNPVTSGGVYTAEKALSDAIEAILLLIPSAATALNKLVDTNTMNSSISTATATFRGTYNAVSDLGLTYQATHAQIEAALDALGLTADNNDFAFVQIPVSDQSQDIAKTERFKFNGTNWLYEYDLNTSGFTAAQWAAINSTITLALVQKLAALPTNAELLQALGLKQDVLTFDNAPTTDSNNPVKSGGIKTAIDTAVGDEATARENADTELSGLIGDEKTRAEGVEGGLDTRLGAVEGSVSTIQDVIPSEATSSNKLVDYSSMTTYIGTIIDNIDATFNVTSTDGHVTLAITQENGVITSVQLTTSDIASAAALNLKASQADLNALAGRVTTAEGNITSLTGRMTTAEGDIDQLLALYNALQQSSPQVIQPTDTWPVANPSTTVIYRVIDRVNTPPEYYSDYMWNGTSMVLMATYNNAVDTTPKKDSANLITSGGVFANIGAFDISEYHKSGSTLATYADLTAALAALPSDFQKGGMSIKFVQTSDNKYVQYRLMADDWSTNTNDWAICDDSVLIENPEFAGVLTDKENRIAIGIKKDGDVYFGAGIPKQIRDKYDDTINTPMMPKYKVFTVNDMVTKPSGANGMWSGFLSLDGVDEITINSDGLPSNRHYHYIYFYKNPQSSYTFNSYYRPTDADVAYGTSMSITKLHARFKVPKGIHYMSFELLNPTDYVMFSYAPSSVNDADAIEKLMVNAKCISDASLPFGDPNLLIDDKGICYETYSGGLIEHNDPHGGMGFAKFPLVQPEKAAFNRPFISGQKVTSINKFLDFWEHTIYWKTPYTEIRCLTFGRAREGGDWLETTSMRYFDISLEDGTIQNFEETKWADDNTSPVNCTTMRAKMVADGLTPYSSADITMVIATTHVQEYNGYKYTTINFEGDCPIIVRSDDDFETIEYVKGFQIDCKYEAALVINGSDWYITVRKANGIAYAYSTNAGVTWSEFEDITESIGSKPRGLVLGNKIVFAIPAQNQCFKTYNNNINGVLVGGRYGTYILVGDKNTPINEWKKEWYLTSKYGVSYGDLLLVGDSDIYYAYNTDKVHISSSQLPIGGKSHVMLTHLGNPNNLNLFGDY